MGQPASTSQPRSTRGPHVWTVRAHPGGPLIYMGPRLVDAMSAYGDPNDPACTSVLYRDGRRLSLDDGQPPIEGVLAGPKE